jgi:sugar lactone lactonase YvrE
MSSRWPHWLRKRPGARSPRRRLPYRPQLNTLEERVVPAFNLTIGNGATTAVLVDNVNGTLTATGTGANVNLVDVIGQLAKIGHSTISDGTAGTEAGTITWLPGANLNINTFPPDSRQLTIAVDPSATAGTVTLGSTIFDSDQNVVGLNVSVSATKDLVVNASLNVGAGALTLAADVKPDGTGDDGIGTLTVGPGVALDGGSVTLRGADVHLDTSANPAVVTAVKRTVNIFAGLVQPAGVAVDAAGNVYVADSFRGSVFKVTATGQPSTFVSGLNGPDGLAFDAQGNLYVANRGTNSVLRVTPDGQTVTTFVTNISVPSGLAFDPKGNLDVASRGSNAVFQVTPDGQTSTLFVRNLATPVGLAFDAQGNLFVSNSGTPSTIVKVAPNGTRTTFGTSALSFNGLAFDAQGNLYASNAFNGTVLKFTPDGRTTVTYATGQGNPYGLAFDVQGNLYVADSGNGVLNKVTPGTVMVRSSLPARPIAVGGTAGAVAGVNLTGPELARLTGAGLVLGDGGQTGDISFVTAAPTAPVVARQSTTAGTGRIVLDDGGGTAPALNAGSNDIVLSAGPGGIVAADTSNATAEIATIGNVTLNTPGPVGSAAARIQLDAAATPAAVDAGGVFPSTGIFLDGLGDLTVGSAVTAAGGTVDVTARGNLTVPNGAIVSAPVISLAADVKADGTGDDGVGTSIVGDTATVAGGQITLRGADLTLNTTGNFNLIAATRQAGPFAPPIATAAGVAVDGQGNVFVAAGTTVSKVTPAGQAAAFASGLTSPASLALDGQGNLFVVDNGAVRKVTPGGQVSVFVTTVPNPLALAVDGQGNLFVASSQGTTISKVTPAGQVSAFVTLANTVVGLATDGQGNLYAADSNGIVSKVTPDGAVSPFVSGLGLIHAIAADPQGNVFLATQTGNLVGVTPDGNAGLVFRGLTNPKALVVDAQDNAVVVNGDGTLTRLTPGTIAVRSSLESRPISVGGPTNAVAGINLTGTEFSRLSAGSVTGTEVLTVGDAGQTGDITFAGVGSLTTRTQVVQSPTGPGTIVFDETGGAALTVPHGSVELTPGTGGVRETNLAAGSVAVAAGTLVLTSAGPVGTLARPFAVNAARLGAGSAPGILFLNDAGNLTTAGTFRAASSELTLGGDFTTRPGDLHAAALDLFFTGAGTQHLDSGGQSFSDLVHSGTGTLQLINHPLNVSGNLIGAGDVRTGDLAVTVGGLTTLTGGTWYAGAAPESFLGGLVVNGGFSGDSGAVTAGGVTLGVSGILIAPSGTLTDTGDWSNAGGVFNANGGTVVLAGVNQHLTGSTTFHNLTKTAAAADTLTFAARSTQTITGQLTLQGPPGSFLLLRSSAPGTQWNLNLQGTVALANLDVQDSANTSGTPLAPAGARDSGDNTGWVFPIVVPQLTVTTTMLSGSPNPVGFGQPVTFTATVAAASGPAVPAGTVTFALDGVPQQPVTLVNGAASLALPSLAAGLHTVTAAYAGSTTFTPSAAALIETVNPATLTATTTPPVNPVTIQVRKRGRKFRLLLTNNTANPLQGRLALIGLSRKAFRTRLLVNGFPAVAVNLPPSGILSLLLPLKRFNPIFVPAM